ncbi:MAG: trigger factor family protein, partial [Flavobacteriaceae bacterium]
MNISRTDIDALNALVTIQIDRSDFEKNVNAVLSNYRKTANIPGFRKGHVPMGMIKKQYEQAVTADEINKILRENLDSYLKDENIELLGNPLPKETDQPINWRADSLDFEFELGLAPKFDIKLDSLKKVIRYDIEPDKKMVQEQQDYLTKQYGKLVSQTQPEKGFEITAQFRNEVLEIEKISTFTLEDIQSKKGVKDLKTSSTDSILNQKIKGFFKEDSFAKQTLGVDDTQWDSIQESEITIELKEINERIPAELNQELFDKLFEPGTVSSESDFQEKIKENLKKQF